MINNLSGSAKFKSVQPLWKSIDMIKIINLPRKSIADKRAVYNEAVQGLNNGITRFKEAGGEVLLNGSKVSADNIRALGAKVSADYAVQYDISTGELDSTVSISTTNIHGIPLTFPVEVQGNIKDMEPRYNLNKLLKEIFRAA